MDWSSFARRVESIGYGGLVMADHVVGNGLSPFPALAAAAAATTRLRLGTLVLDNDFRNPLLLAREAATVDVISSGRLELVAQSWKTPVGSSVGSSFTVRSRDANCSGTRGARADDADALLSDR